jgi:hypothetical protein
LTPDFDLRSMRIREVRKFNEVLFFNFQNKQYEVKNSMAVTMMPRFKYSAALIGSHSTFSNGFVYSIFSHSKEFFNYGRLALSYLYLNGTILSHFVSNLKIVVSVSTADPKDSLNLPLSVSVWHNSTGPVTISNLPGSADLEPASSSQLPVYLSMFRGLRLQTEVKVSEPGVKFSLPPVSKPIDVRFVFKEMPGPGLTNIAFLPGFAAATVNNSGLVMFFSCEDQQEKLVCTEQGNFNTKYYGAVISQADKLDDGVYFLAVRYTSYLMNRDDITLMIIKGKSLVTKQIMEVDQPVSDKPNRVTAATMVNVEGKDTVFVALKRSSKVEEWVEIYSYDLSQGSSIDFHYNITSDSLLLYQFAPSSVSFSGDRLAIINNYLTNIYQSDNQIVIFDVPNFQKSAQEIFSRQPSIRDSCLLKNGTALLLLNSISETDFNSYISVEVIDLTPGSENKVTDIKLPGFSGSRTDLSFTGCQNGARYLGVAGRNESDIEQRVRAYLDVNELNTEGIVRDLLPLGRRTIANVSDVGGRLLTALWDVDARRWSFEAPHYAAKA